MEIDVKSSLDLSRASLIPTDWDLSPEVLSLAIGSLSCELVKRLGELKIKLSCAESCTGGLLASYVTSVPGASAVFELGAVTYSERMKSELLGIPGQLIEDCNVVSDNVAMAMAIGVRLLAGADIGIGITGIAGPDGGSAERPVGTVFVSINYNNQSFTENLRLYELGSLTREQCRFLTVAYAVKAALIILKG